MTLAFVDTETTGLDPDRHEIWEVALILHDPPDVDGKSQPDREHVWQLPVDLGKADLIALNIGQWQARRWPPYRGKVTSESPQESVYEWTGGGDRQLHDVGDHVWPSDHMGDWADRFSTLTWGAHMVGAVPSFDDQRLARLLRRHGSTPGWHYHLVDVETLAVGWQLGRWVQAKLDAPKTGMQVQEGPFRIEYPWDSKVLSEAVGVHPDQYEAHTALGDCRWALDLYRRLTGEV